MASVPLYAVDRVCPAGPPGGDLRRRLRNERSREVVERIGAWAITAKTRALPESGLVKAIDYMLSATADGGEVLPAAAGGRDVGRGDRAQLGVKRHTLVGWTAMPEVAAAMPTFVPVSVIADAPAVSRIVVHGLGGVRIEGLDLAGVVALLRRLV